MRISKKDALMWMEFFAGLPEDEPLPVHQQELALAAIAQIERAVARRRESMLAAIPNLKTLAGRTMYVGSDEKFPRGCKSCLLGSGLGAIRRTNICNLECRFCYNYGELDCQEPIGDGLWEIGGAKYYEEDVPLLLSVQKKPSGVSYVYLEPFMEIEQYYGIISRFHQSGVHQHMYTNGTLAAEENLRALDAAGLDELRFNLGATGCADSVIEAMKTAKRFIPQVGIETPMTPEFYEKFFKKKEKILSTGIDFINCAELHLNENNAGNYEGEPMYMTRLGYVSPIWSRDLTLRFMRRAAEENWPLAVHDCSNMTKIARDLNLKAHEGGWFGASGYGREFSSLPYALFLPALRDETLPFVSEEPLPDGYRVGDIVL